MKKLAIVAAMLTLIVLAVRLWPSHQGATPPTTSASTRLSAPPPPPAQPATTAPPDHDTAASPTATDNGPYSTHPEAKKAWEPVVEGFAMAYPHTGGVSRSEWLAHLRPFLTRAVIAALANADPTKVPTGRYAGYEVLEQADESLTVRVTYQEGWALVLYVVALGNGHWVIDSFDRSLDFD